ncbi:unnamed protein product [Paramecium sonneborni]|uniref:WD40-repeat-containing domain n=1 Tax=Paramecium sonneborni TaxID=65129 RepID=A0A8S1L290_9CILI|nr:unnamed protein product [Paramecium sonneborni]
MLSCQMIEQQNELRCSNNHQDQPIIMVLLDEEYQQNQRFKCPLCLAKIKGKVNCLSYEEALIKIQDQKDQVYSLVTTFVTNNIKELDDFLNHIEIIKTELIQTISQIENHINLWKSQLLQLSKQASSYSILKEIDNINISNESLIDQEKYQFIEKLNQVNDAFQCKTINHFKSLREIFNKEQTSQIFQMIQKDNRENEQLLNEQCLQTEIQLNNDQKESSNQQLAQTECSNLENTEKDKLVQSNEHENILQQSCTNENIINELSQLQEKTYYKLQGELQQKEACIALAINFDGSLVAASCNNDIKIWKFQNGNMIDQKIILKGHENIVFCIIFSKKINWFVSGGTDNQIRCWTEKNKRSWFSSHNWEGSKAYIQHTNSILCLLLNENEDQLISSSCDNSIKIWNIKCSDNSLLFQYSLEKHKNQVFQISLNSKETQMVSCSEDQQIILWGKDVSNKWEFKYTIDHNINDYGLRINFLSDDTIFWCQFSQPFIHVFKLENEKFQQQSNMKIQLKSLSEDCNWCDYCFFPSKYNNQKQVLIIKQNKYIYKIQQNQDQQYQLDSSFIECSAACIYGAIQDNLQHIIIWNKELKLFQIYQIQEK